MKKTNKNLVLDLLEKDALNNGFGLTTEQVAAALYMHRANASKLLNELVLEEFVNKTEGSRPVLYSRSSKNFDRSSHDPFNNIVGKEGSLKQAVNLAKAAVLYPNKSLPVLLIGGSGAGKKTLSDCMYHYAINMGVLTKDAVFKSVNCHNYENRPEELHALILQLLSEAEDGLLYISYFNYLDDKSKDIIMSLLENECYLVDGKRHNQKTILVCSVASETDLDQFSKAITDRFSIKIELPSLEKRSMQEKYELITLFLEEQSGKSNKTIQANSEVLLSFLLYRANDSVKQLQKDIGLVCASSYAREMKTRDNMIRLQVSDLPQHIRSSILNYRNKKEEVDSIIDKNQHYIFTNDNVSTVKNTKNKEKDSIYKWIDDKKNELQKRGLSDSEISAVVNVGIEEAFARYRKKLSLTVSDTSQLRQLVDYDIYEGVSSLINEAAIALNRVYSVSDYYGLCLHIQNLVDSKTSRSDMKVDNLIDFINNNRTEYSLAEQYARNLEKKHNISISIDEVAIIAMFLCEKKAEQFYETKPSVLIAMHGNGIAREMAEVIGLLSDSTVYHYDMPLTLKPLDAYENIKNLLNDIPSEKGVLVIHDAGSFADIFNMISMEMGIIIKTIEIPLSTFMFDCCRKAKFFETADQLGEDIINTYKNVSIASEKKEKLAKVIITFCMTGEGGAAILKDYIEKNYDLNGVEVIALQLRQQTEFVLELNKIRNEKYILALIGTFNPNIYGIPYIPIEEVFKSENNLNALLEEKKKSDREYVENVDAIFESLKYELAKLDIVQFKKDILQFIDTLETEGGSELDENQRLGLILHVACAVSRLMDNEPLALNPYMEEIINKNTRLFRVIEKAAVPFERTAGIKIDTNEISHIISIIKKSRRG